MGEFIVSLEQGVLAKHVNHDITVTRREGKSLSLECVDCYTLLASVSDTSSITGDDLKKEDT